MSPAARDAQLDFVRLTAEEPSSLYFEEFLRSGFAAWPACYQTRFPSLGTWHGVAGLKQSLRQLAGAPADWQVLLASRSLSLVQLAARSMFRVCRNVLATDLSWPTYQQTLDRRAARTGSRITIATLREQILRRGWTANDVAEHLARAFVQNRCDGLFLPAVDHLGVRLPVRDIIQSIERRAALRFVFIDAAQAFCQVPIDDCFDCADFIVAGTHKWMHGYLPMGIGFFGRSRSRELLEHKLRQLRRSGQTNDPLLHFTEQLEHDDLDSHSETANLSSLLTSAGAAADASTSVLRNDKPPGDELDAFLAQLPKPSGEWRPLLPANPMRSRIAILKTAESPTCKAPPDAIREQWLASGSVVSAYPHGLVRVSLPDASRN